MPGIASSRRCVFMAAAVTAMLLARPADASCKQSSQAPFVVTINTTSAVLRNAQWIYYNGDGQPVPIPVNSRCVARLCEPSEDAAKLIKFSPLTDCGDSASTTPDGDPSTTAGCFAVSVDSTSTLAQLRPEMSFESTCYLESGAVTAPMHIRFAVAPPVCKPTNVPIVSDPAAATTSAIFFLSAYDTDNNDATFELSGLAQLNGTLEQCVMTELSLDGCNNWLVISSGPGAANIANARGTLRYNMSAAKARETIAEGAAIDSLRYRATDVFGKSCEPVGTITFRTFKAGTPVVTMLAPVPVPSEVETPFIVLLKAASPVVAASSLKWVPSMREDSSTACVAVCNNHLPATVTQDWINSNLDPAKMPKTTPGRCTRNAPTFNPLETLDALKGASYVIVTVDPTRCTTSLRNFTVGVRATDGVAYDHALITSSFTFVKEGKCAQQSRVTVEPGKTVTHVPISDGGPLTFDGFVNTTNCDGFVVVAEPVSTLVTQGIQLIPRIQAVRSLAPVASVTITAMGAIANGATCNLVFFSHVRCELTIAAQAGAVPLPPPPATTSAAPTTPPPMPPPTTAAPPAGQTTKAPSTPTTAITPTTATPVATPTGSSSTASPPTEAPATTTTAPGTTTSAAPAVTTTTTPSSPPDFTGTTGGGAVEDTRLISFPMLLLICAAIFAAFYFRGEIIILGRLAISRMTGTTAGFAAVGRSNDNGGDDDENAPHSASDTKPLRQTAAAAAAVPVPAQQRPRPARVRRTSSDDDDESRGKAVKGLRGAVRVEMRPVGRDSSPPPPSAAPPRGAAPTANTTTAAAAKGGWDAEEEEWQ